MCGVPLTASAQTAPATEPAATHPVDHAPNGKDIIVTARKPVTTSEALTFARAASAPVQGQLAKFDTPVCPVAIGFPAAVGAQITARMRDVAAAAGVALEKPGCKGTMVLIAATDGAALLREMQRVDHHLIAGTPPREIAALIRSTDPVRSWTFSVVENEDGVSPSSSGANTVPVLNVFSASNLNPPVQQAIKIAVVVIDWPAMIGKSAVQIADYAAMRTLARTRPVTGGGAIDSILALFDPAASAPPELSGADLAYLRGLYAMPGLRFAHLQIGEISNGVKKEARAAP